MAIQPDRILERAAFIIETPATTFHGWSDLPDELKVEILSHALTFDKPISYTGSHWHGVIDCCDHGRILRGLLFPFIGTRNRHLAALAQEVYYSKNTFVVLIISGERRIDRRSYLWHPKAVTSTLIRHLIVRMRRACIENSLEDMFLHPSHCWKWLLRPRRSLDVSKLSVRSIKPWNRSITSGYKKTADTMETHTTWQLNFSKIQDLTLDITVCDLFRIGQGSETNPEALRKLEGWLSESELMFKAKKAQAHVKVCSQYRCKAPRDGHSDMLKGMAKRAERGH